MLFVCLVDFCIRIILALNTKNSLLVCFTSSVSKLDLNIPQLSKEEQHYVKSDTRHRKQ